MTTVSVKCLKAAIGCTLLPAKFIASYMLNVRSLDDKPHHPLTANELKECIDLFEDVKEWDARKKELIYISADWARLMHAWPELATKKNNEPELHLLLEDVLNRPLPFTIVTKKPRRK